MKAAIISLHFAEYAVSLALELAADHEILLVLHENNAQNELLGFDALIRQSQVALHLVPFVRSGNPLGLLNAKKILDSTRQFKPDLVHFQETLRDYEFLSALLLKKYPFVLTIHDHQFHTGARENILKKNLYRPVMRALPDAVIVHGKGIASETERMLPKLKGRIFPIHHGILPAKPEPFTPGWEIGNLLFFGRIEPYKGLKYFVQAVKSLYGRGIPVKGVIAGKGNPDPKEMETIQKLPCFELINHYIPADEVRDLFLAANGVVLPYTDATQSGVMALALGHGRPAVATRVGGLPEVVRNGHNGLLVPAEDAAALAAALERLVTDQAFALKMAQNAHNMAQEAFSWREAARKTSRVYKDALRFKARSKA